MLKLLKTLLSLIMFGACFSALAVNGESIVINPSTGNYLITYYSAIGKKFEQRIFIPATKINPIWRSNFKFERDDFHYVYSLTSGRDSKQDIVLLILDPVSSVTSNLPAIPLNAPPGKIMGDMKSVANYFEATAPWDASMGYSDNQTSFRIGWSVKVANGFHPGNKANFGFKSNDLPGIIQSEIYGYAAGSLEIDGEELPEAEDRGFGQQYFALINNNFLRRPAAVPTIAVPNPFNAAVLLGNIQTQMHTWIAMQLLDATFSSQLDRYLTAAADAYSHNQPKVVKEDIEKIRELLKREHQDLGRDEEHENDKNQEKNDDKKARMIDRLAAKVLDFDLKYVLKRMSGDKDD